MITIIRNAEVYAPEYLGKKDVLLLGSKIAAVDEHVSFNINGPVEVSEIDAGGKALIPGFIDSHSHIQGGGGEGNRLLRSMRLWRQDIFTH